MYQVKKHMPPGRKASGQRFQAQSSSERKQRQTVGSSESGWNEAEWVMLGCIHADTDPDQQEGHHPLTNSNMKKLRQCLGEIESKKEITYASSMASTQSLGVALFWRIGDDKRPTTR